MHFRVWWLILLLTVLVILSSFNVKTEASLTERFLDNTSGNLRPQKLELKETNCGFLGLSCLLAPKSDFTKDIRSSREEESEERNIFEEIAQFFSYIFGQAKGKRGYARSYTPKTILDKSQSGRGEDDVVDEQDIEIAHKDLFQALLPRQFRDDVRVAIIEAENIQTGKESSIVNQVSSRLNYFSQRDPEYQSGSGGITTSRCGCGPTSAAMIVNGYRDSSANPKTMWNAYRSRGYLNVCGTRVSENQTVLRDYGFTISAEGTCGSNCLAEIDRYLEANSERVAFILAYLRSGTTENGISGCVLGGHYFLYTKDGFWDPYYGYGKPAPASLSSLNYQCQNFRYYFIVELK